MDNILVSVVIPTFNKSRLIQSTLRSICNQTYKNIELILVDNGSSDSTRAEIDEFLSTNHVKFKILDLKENKGPSNARNQGIINSSGNYIFLLDGDDLFMPEKISIQVDFMERNPEVGLSLTPYFIYSKPKKPIRLIKNLNVRSLISNWLHMTGFGGLVESTGCIRRSAINSSLFFNLAFMGSEGLDFTKKWSDQSCVKVLPEPLTIYRLSPNGLHYDTIAIRENVSRLVKVYETSQSQRSRSLRIQSEYFKLDILRAKPKIEIIMSILSSIFTFDTPALFMISVIVRRNFAAYFRGLGYKKSVLSCLRLAEQVND